MARRKKKGPRRKPRKISRARARPAKRSHHKKPFRKKSRSERQSEKIKRLEKVLRQQTADIRMRDHALRELTLTQRVTLKRDDEDEDDGDEDSGFSGRVKGEKLVKDSSGETIGYELPYVLDSADFDFEDDLDYDEYFDDVGEEENDSSYGEDEAK